ncbi:MAG TPA: hypothetical protein P5168_03295 [Candidatus Methanomethylicus sp.]|jgi:hypothetical protein|nr:hypothetical protein [Candidatus Methanomethylicus sp.]HRU81557.1 hypothetical protein [Candidatus Methanomethylicus sp.]
MGRHTILGLEISTGRLALRIAAGVMLAAVLFAFLSLLPMAAQGILSEFLPEEFGAFYDVIAPLIHPALPFTGAAIAFLSLLIVVLRGSAAYGPVTAAFGLAFIAHILLAFSFGTPSLAFPPEMITQALQEALNMPVAIDIELAAYADLTGLMLVFMLPFILTVIKGVILTVSRRS